MTAFLDGLQNQTLRCELVVEAFSSTGISPLFPSETYSGRRPPRVKKERHHFVMSAGIEPIV